MQRYFIEVFYKGTGYAGFQVQKNANSIQAEVEKALSIFFRSSFSLTGSSRTDSGVHALCNFFHFDAEVNLPAGGFGKVIYNLNAILPPDIVVKNVYPVAAEASCRFDAIKREYRYFIYQHKDPFRSDRAYYYPYELDLDALNAAARSLLRYQDFSSFSKRNTQVKSFICDITTSEWLVEDGMIVYKVAANRFLRGMVRGLVGTMLKVGRGRMALADFISIIELRDSSLADFSVPPQGLFLMNIQYG